MNIPNDILDKCSQLQMIFNNEESRASRLATSELATLEKNRVKLWADYGAKIEEKYTEIEKLRNK